MCIRDRRHAASVERFIAVDHQQRYGAIAAQLDGESPRLLEVVCQEQGGGAHPPEQINHRRRIIAIGKKLPPDGAKAYDGAADIEVIKHEALNAVSCHPSSRFNAFS